MGLIPGLGRSPGGGRGNPLQYFCLGESHGQRSLVGYSPWDHTEWDTTEATEHKQAHSMPESKDVLKNNGLMQKKEKKRERETNSEAPFG